jgi:hypothetical protein
MDWDKYNLIPDDFKTAREIGLAAATLGAMARRGLVEIKDTSPKQYRKLNGDIMKIYYLCEIYSDQYDTYFGVYKDNDPIGMLCSLTDGTIVDCMGERYDLNNVVSLRFGKKMIKVKEN